MNDAPLRIRALAEGDRDAFLRIVEEVASEGDSYVFDEHTDRRQLHQYWFGQGEVRAAYLGERLAGGYLIKPNHIGRGSHIANMGYVVAREARGRGIGRLLCRDSIEYAKSLGYRGIQFNLVVATNTAAVALWRSEGFEIIGTAPGVFRHPSRGFVDAHIMFMDLTAPRKGQPAR